MAWEDAYFAGTTSLNFSFAYQRQVAKELNENLHQACWILFWSVKGHRLSLGKPVSPMRLIAAGGQQQSSEFTVSSSELALKIRFMKKVMTKIRNCLPPDCVLIYNGNQMGYGPSENSNTSSYSYLKVSFPLFLSRFFLMCHIFRVF